MKDRRLSWGQLIFGAILILSLTGFIQTESRAEDDSSLAAQWSFDKGQGETIEDGSANNNDGKIFGATWGEGKFGSGLKFDGEDDYVEVNDSTSLGIPGEVTIEAWINVDASEFSGTGGDTSGFLVSKTGNWRGYQLRLLDNESVLFWIRNSAGTEEEVKVPGGTISANTWYHIVGVADNTNLYIYVNGVLENTASRTGGDIHVHDHPLWIGKETAWFDNPQAYFQGSIDEVRIYNRALTADEISDHYKGIKD